MTSGMVLLLIFCSWIALAVYLGKSTRRASGKRWHQVAVMALVLWLPLWDVIPGYILYRQAIREISGVRIHRTVEVEGYLDLTRGLVRDAWRDQLNSPYEYTEVWIPTRDPQPNSLTAEPGYYEFRLAPRDRPECAPFDAQQINDWDKFRASTGLQDRCVVATRRDAPISRYELALESEWLPASRVIDLVEAGCWRVRDRLADEVIAEACTVSFDSWLSRWIGVPVWRHRNLASGQPIALYAQTKVLRPVRKLNEETAQ
jgi:hypothetical protein